MRGIRAWTFAVCVAGLVACGGDDEHLPDSRAADAAADGPTDASSDAPVRACGGLGGEVCETAQFCDWTDNGCGGDDGQGTCQPRPVACPDLLIAEPVCGCDGQVYSSECDAQAAGVDLSLLGNCTTPVDTFPCGYRFCRLPDQYCLRSVSDVVGFPDEWECIGLPAACSPTINCACVAQETCGDMCAGNAAQGLTVTCPGG